MPTDLPGGNGTRSANSMLMVTGKNSLEYPIKKIIWAFDPFEVSPGIQQNIGNVLRKLVGKLRWTIKPAIEPVFILNPEQLNLPHEYSSLVIENYRPTAEKAAENRLSHMKGLPDLMPPRVLIEHRVSQRTLVQHFLQYAESAECDLIVVGTHANTGLSRMILGSFAEGILAQSKIPTLVINPNAEFDGTQNTVLFPTDLMKGPLNPVFLKVLKITSQLGANLRILHAIPKPIEPVFQSGVYLLGGGWVPVPNFLEKQGGRQREIIQAWKDFAIENGVPTESEVHIGAPGIVDSILAEADFHKPGFIIMEAQRGPIAAAILGSLTRSIVRSARCPVWVLRSA